MNEYWRPAMILAVVFILFISYILYILKSVTFD